MSNELTMTAGQRLLDRATKRTPVTHGHTSEIELTSNTTTRGIRAMEDM
ncbi:hypothetical protein [Rhodococcus erythropolis]